MSESSPMRLLRGRIKPAVFTGSVVTIGKFDGLHRGHRALLARTGEQASLLALPAVLLSFEPLPPEFFSRAKARLSSFAQKWRLLADTATIDTLACLRFDRALAALSAEDFVA
ncbi:MAG TPA: hypothetical protein VFX38_08555, partial [Gammaproteobacteria bacterium]|nr:hypothetical protein [Gammaproteobacteria bacterium]